MASKLFSCPLDKNKERVQAKPSMKLETTDSHAADKFHKSFGRIYYLSRFQWSRNLNEPSACAYCDQVLIQRTLEPRKAIQMFEQTSPNLFHCQSATSRNHHHKVELATFKL